LNAHTRRLRQLTKQRVWRNADRAANLNKFDDLEAPLAALIFGHKGLVPAKSGSKLLLGEL